MIKLSVPFIPEDALQECNSSILSGNLVQGRYVEKFESKLANYLSVDHVVMVSSGTSALHLALIALGIGANDEVIIPSYSFTAVANVVELTGAIPVFVDINLDDFCLDTSAVESIISTRTKAIIAVHEFGQSVDLNPLIQLANKRQIHVIEDAACAIGTEYCGKKVGGFGIMGCFSFHPRKIITTGEGGAIVTNDSKIANQLRILRNHGISKIGDKIDFTIAGFNYRMTDFQAALGTPQLELLDETIKINRMQANLYHQIFSTVDAITTDRTYIDRRQTYQTYHILLDKEIDRDTVKSTLYNQGIETNYGAYNMPSLEYYKQKYGYKIGDHPNGEYAFNHGLALPLGRHINMQDVEFIGKQVIEAIQYAHKSESAVY